MVPQLPQATKSQRHRRSPLMVAAYCMLVSAIVLMLLDSEVYWTAGTMGMAVLLALGELVVQLRRRRVSAYQAPEAAGSTSPNKVDTSPYR